MTTKKLTYEYVKTFIEEQSGGDCELLSNEYVNSLTPLALKCKCGNVFYKPFANCKNGFFICKECMNKHRSEKYRNNFYKIKQFIEENGCQYISGEYKNSTSLLTLKCKCGNLFQKNYNHFKKGQRRCPQCGAESSRQSKFKYNIESVKEILLKRGYTLLEDTYLNCTTPLKCVCSKGHNVNIIFQQFLAGCSGCKKCQYEDLRVKNRKYDKNPESEVLTDLRDSVKYWKGKIFQKYEGKCYLTNTRKDCVVHHLYPFRTIVDDCCKELNIPLHRNIGDYDLQQYNKLKDLVISKHTLEIGIVLQRKVHAKFHSIYGLKNNTVEQFNEFIKKYYPKQLNNLIAKRI